MRQGERRVEVDKGVLRHTVPYPPARAFGHGRILHGLRGGDVVALQITPAGLEGTAHLGEQRRFLQNGIMMQRFKGNRGIKAAFSQIAGKIVCAKQGEPFSGVLAGKPLQHVRREVHSRHRQIGKAS